MAGVALVGLGEVGRVFAEDLAARGVADVTPWDTAFGEPGSRASRNAADLGLAPALGPHEAVASSDLVVSAVTAANCLAAAESVAGGLAPGAWFFDLNSSSPAQKQAAAAVVEAAGGRYVEAALMSPIGPRRLDSPFLLGGPHAAEFAAQASRFGLTSTTVFSDTVGRAAATKLCRSVVVKGLEALLTESVLAARSYGVEAEVLGSLSNILPPADWERVAQYFVSRSLQHGVRRAEEMLEAAATVADAGVEPLMSRAAAQRQSWAAQHADALSEPDLVAMADHILRAVRAETDAATREPAP